MCGLDIDDHDDITRVRRKKRKRDRKKRRIKKYGDDESSADELMEFQTSNKWQGLHSGGKSWFLSTDGYSCAWNSVWFSSFPFIFHQ